MQGSEQASLAFLKLKWSTASSICVVRELLNFGDCSGSRRSQQRLSFSVKFERPDLHRAVLRLIVHAGSV